MPLADLWRGGFLHFEGGHLSCKITWQDGAIENVGQEGRITALEAREIVPMGIDMVFP